LKIVPTINRGLAIKGKKSQGGEASSQKMTMRLDWVDKLNWEVIVVEDKRITAVCFAGGKIVVATRILELFHTDDEIAAILAHEVCTCVC
jgi:Zn-dependent protease with chaperone function